LDKVLEELKAVQGVSGVLILDLQRLVTYQLLPAHFEKSLLHNLAMNLLTLCRKIDEPIRIDLKFDKGVAFIARLNHSAILIYGRPSLNPSLLKLVLKSSVRTIERRLEREREQAKQRFEDNPQIQVYVKPLVEALNQITSVYRKYIGTYPLTQNLREAKERLSGEFPVLTNFFVDNNGSLSVIKGRESLIREDATLSFSRWVSLLTELCQKISPEIRELKIRDLTKDSVDQLEKMGFYELCEK